MLDVEMAKIELSRKSMSDINRETAWKWASRAAAAFELSKDLAKANKALKFSQGQEFMGEAKEHAAQVSVECLEDINKALSNYFVEALLDLDKDLKGEKNV